MSSQKKSSIGLEKKIKDMDPKLKKLFLNIMSMMMILMLVYAIASYIIVYLDSGSFMRWFSSEHFVTSAVVLIFLAFGSKILKGGEIKVPEQFKKKEGQKTTFNIPDTYGIRGQGLNLSGKNQKQQPQQKQQPRPQQQQLNIPNYFGQKPQGNLNIPNYFGPKQQQRKGGSWKCPNCQSLVVGNRCQKCGYWRR